MRLESIGNVVVAVAGLLGVFSAGSGTYAGFIGISLVYGMRVTGMLNWAVRSTTELATQMCVRPSGLKIHVVPPQPPDEVFLSRATLNIVFISSSAELCAWC